MGSQIEHFLDVECWELNVECFPSVQGFNARLFRGILSPFDPSAPVKRGEGENKNSVKMRPLGLHSGCMTLTGRKPGISLH